MWAIIWQLVRSKAFRDAIKSILWPRIIRPFLFAAGKELFEESYERVLRAVISAEGMAERGEIEKDEKYAVAWRLITEEAEQLGLYMSKWMKASFIELAVAEIDNKWEEFK